MLRIKRNFGFGVRDYRDYGDYLESGVMRNYCGAEEGDK